MFVSLEAGATVCFFGGDVFKLKDDLAIVKPTIFVSVPRLYNKFYAAIKGKLDAATGIKGFLGQRAINTKLDKV